MSGAEKDPSRTSVLPDSSARPAAQPAERLAQEGGIDPCSSARLLVQATLAYRFSRPAEVLLLLEAARTQMQAVFQEQLIINPVADIARLDDSITGERRAVFVATGDVEVNYSAVVDLRPEPPELAGLPAPTIAELPSAAINFLLPSRYCPSDRLQGFVAATFQASSAGDRVLAILEWLQRNIEYSPGVSDAGTDAMETLAKRAGVCRDFTHLAIAFCRAANIPARAVSVYAWRLDPPDMHAVTEVFLGGRWHLIDPTGRAPTQTMVRVATGRDAGDIAFMTVFGEAELLAQTFAVTHLSAEGVPIR
ncbi:MAG: transglutaminase family protein [Alphaproteobacteria bacterium]|nr:transglutaminase family protein [Alphaproteobacteria bacterium]